MTWDLIQKTRRAAPAPNLADDESECRAFSWEAARRPSFCGLPDGAGLNIAYEAVDRHLDRPQRDHVALRRVDKDDEVVEFSAFGPEPIRERLRLGDGRVLVTTPELPAEDRSHSGVLARLEARAGDRGRARA